MREQIEEEERKAEEKRQSVNKLQQLTCSLAELETRFQQKQEALVQAERDRSELLLYEEEMRLRRKLQQEQQ